MNLTNNAKGILLATVGIICLSPDSLLIRMIDVDLWTLTFLRSIFIGLSLFLFNFIVNRGNALRQFVSLDKYAVMIALSMAISNIFFVASIQTTSVAHTLIIVGAAPVVAAVLGLVFIKEKVAGPTWITILVVTVCLIFVVYDDQQSSFKGDMYALIACLLWSANFVLARRTRMTNMVAAMCLSGFFNAIWSFPIADFSNLTFDHLWLSLLLGTFVGLALAQITMAPRFIPAAEVALFMPIETVLGALLVWWFIGEYPGVISMVAGSIMILAIMLNSYFQIKYSTS